MIVNQYPERTATLIGLALVLLTALFLPAPAHAGPGHKVPVPVRWDLPPSAIQKVQVIVVPLGGEMTPAVTTEYVAAQRIAVMCLEIGRAYMHAINWIYPDGTVSSSTYKPIEVPDSSLLMLEDPAGRLCN